MAKDNSQGFKWCESCAALTSKACHILPQPHQPDRLRRRCIGVTARLQTTHCLAACRRNTVAGCTAGFIPVLALHPLDVVKTRLQGGSAHKHIRYARCKESAAWQTRQCVVATTI
jgi:Mitochondrial carrier protein